MLLRDAPRVDDVSDTYDLSGAMSRSRSRWQFLVPSIFLRSVFCFDAAVQTVDVSNMSDD